MITVENLDELVTTAEAAEHCGVTQAMIRNWAQRGKLTKSGLDERNRPMYKLIDVLRADRDSRRSAWRGRVRSV